MPKRCILEKAGKTILQHIYFLCASTFICNCFFSSKEVHSRWGKNLILPPDSSHSLAWGLPGWQHAPRALPPGGQIQHHQHCPLQLPKNSASCRPLQALLRLNYSIFPWYCKDVIYGRPKMGYLDKSILLYLCIDRS